MGSRNHSEARPGSGEGGAVLPRQMSLFALLTNVLVSPAQLSMREPPGLLGWDEGRNVNSPGLSCEFGVRLPQAGNRFGADC